MISKDTHKQVAEEATPFEAMNPEVKPSWHVSWEPLYRHTAGLVLALALTSPPLSTTSLISPKISSVVRPTSASAS